MIFTCLGIMVVFVVPEESTCDLFWSRNLLARNTPSPSQVMVMERTVVALMVHPDRPKQ